MRILNARWLILLLFVTGGAATIFAVKDARTVIKEHAGEG